MIDQQDKNEDEMRPAIQVKNLPLLLRPKQTCELFGIDLKALHKLEASGRVKAIRIWQKSSTMIQPGCGSEGFGSGKSLTDSNFCQSSSVVEQRTHKHSIGEGLSCWCPVGYVDRIFTVFYVTAPRTPRGLTRVV